MWKCKRRTRKNVALMHTGCGGFLVSLAQTELWGCGEAWTAQSARSGPSSSFSLIVVWGEGCRGGSRWGGGVLIRFVFTRAHPHPRTRLLYCVGVLSFKLKSFLHRGQI